MAQVEGDRLLAAVDPGEVQRLPVDERAVGAAVVAAVRPLDLDDAGPEIGHQHRRERSGENPAQVDDEKARQRPRPAHSRQPTGQRRRGAVRRESGRSASGPTLRGMQLDPKPSGNPRAPPPRNPPLPRRISRWPSPRSRPSPHGAVDRRPPRPTTCPPRAGSSSSWPPAGPRPPSCRPSPSPSPPARGSGAASSPRSFPATPWSSRAAR